MLHSHTVRLVIALPGFTTTTAPRVIIKPRSSGYELRGLVLAVAEFAGQRPAPGHCQKCVAQQ
jgi:hypothetical protein